MSAAHRAPAERIRHARRRLVSRSGFDRLGALWNSEQLAAVQYGRAAARCIQFHFPAFHAEHIARCSTSPRLLLGVVQAFFSLAQQRVWLDHSDELTIEPNDPLRVLAPSISDVEALAQLEAFHGWGLDEVCPEIYGLPTELDTLFDEGRNLALAILWYLAEPTAWTSPLLDVGEVLTYWIDQGEVSAERAAQLDGIPQLSPGIAMNRLCDALSALPHALPPELDIDLHIAVRFAFSRTGNWFADISADEVAEMGGSGIDWFEANLDEIGALQRQARSACDHYLRLNAYVTSHPDGIPTLVTAVLAAARAAEEGRHHHDHAS